MSEFTKLLVGDELVFACLNLANKYHNGVHRKDSIHCEGVSVALPYFTHPVEIAKRVWIWGAGSHVNVGAILLHDVLEDTHCHPNEIAQIDPQVLEIVQELSFITPVGFEGRELARLKEEYLESFLHKSLYALIDKNADRFGNVNDFKITNPGYAGKYFDKAGPIYQAAWARRREIIERFGPKCMTHIVNDYNAAKSGTNAKDDSMPHVLPFAENDRWFRQFD